MRQHLLRGEQKQEAVTCTLAGACYADAQEVHALYTCSLAS